MRQPTLATAADQGTGFEQYRTPAPRDEVLATIQRSQPAAISNARVLGIFGDSVTTGHISPAGAIKDSSPAGKYLLANGVAKTDFNSYSARCISQIALRSQGTHDYLKGG